MFATKHQGYKMSRKGDLSAQMPIGIIASKPIVLLLLYVALKELPPVSVKYRPQNGLMKESKLFRSPPESRTTVMVKWSSLITKVMSVQME
jgi:hypothetical protein